ncbi:MAG TPA: type VI secretion system tip protein TssI/VgrG, partial [Thermoanaerobaculia bacterium]
MAYTQTGRRLKVKTPLGGDVLLLNGFSGQEAISRPFSFQLQCIAENAQKVPFEALLGQKITVEIALPGDSKRFINGCCLRVAQGGRDAIFTRYLMDLVPEPYLLSRKTQSRIFQHVSVPDILKDVLKDYDVAYDIQGTFQPRDYCVQYRESDFAFASRLMEEEGFYYFFKHSEDGHTMVVANSPSSHPALPVKSTLIYDAVEGGTRDEDRVKSWEKAQELRSGKVTLWDHCFELPHKHLEAEYPIDVMVAAGKSSHKLKLKANAPLELYDYPGAYAQRFDGINKGGGEQPAEIPKIFQDNSRTAEVRMQSEAAGSILVHAASNCRQVVSGHKFTLERHFEGDGSWVVYQVEHVASEAADLRSGGGDFSYQNHFSCFPIALPFRPPRVTPIPVVRGTQTAVVVGPPGEEIFTDKYGRIKVQFHWDREGEYNSDSSCWIRVATPWAGHRWGAIHIPRIGQEVV